MRTLLCSFGHIASYRELIDRCGQDSAVTPLRRASGRRTVLRLRTDVYVCAHLDPDELLAARIGARLDCVTALARLGLPLDSALRRHDDDGCLHLRFRRNDGRASARRRAEARSIRAHWAPLRWPEPTAADALSAWMRRDPISRLEVPLEDALLQALTSCLTPAESVEIIAALLARPGGSPTALAPETLASVIELTPRRVRSRLWRAGLPSEIDDALAQLS